MIICKKCEEEISESSPDIREHFCMKHTEDIDARQASSALLDIK